MSGGTVVDILKTRRVTVNANERLSTLRESPRVRQPVTSDEPVDFGHRSLVRPRSEDLKIARRAKDENRRVLGSAE